jgi:excisionase family DNA binding protein
MKLLLDKHEASAALSISVSTLERMVNDGRIASPVKIGARVLFKRADLQEFVDSLASDRQVIPEPKKARGRPRLAV